MSAPSFRSVFMVASCAGAALGCYLVSLRVASERAALESVETKIVLAQRDIRLLQTEIGTRGRLAQLERWNVKVLALSAPSADQFLDGGFALAKLTRPPQTMDPAAPVVLASAPAPQKPTPLAVPEQAEESTPPAGPVSLMHQASLNTEVRREAPAAAIAKLAPKASAVVAKPAAKAPSMTAKPADKKPTVKTAAATSKPADKKLTEKTATAAAKPVAKPSRLSHADPLAPLPSSKTPKAAKDSGSTR